LHPGYSLKPDFCPRCCCCCGFVARALGGQLLAQGDGGGGGLLCCPVCVCLRALQLRGQICGLCLGCITLCDQSIDLLLG
jgi:hypothetical protein